MVTDAEVDAVRAMKMPEVRRALALVAACDDPDTLLVPFGMTAAQFCIAYILKGRP